MSGLTPDLAAFILSARPDLWKLAEWNPELWGQGPIAVVSHWWGRLRAGNPTDPANKYNDIRTYAIQELAYQPAYPGVPGDVVPISDGPPLPSKPPSTTEAQDQLNTLLMHFQKNGVVYAVAAIAALLVVESGIFRH